MCQKKRLVLKKTHLVSVCKNWLFWAGAEVGVGIHGPRGGKIVQKTTDFFGSKVL